ncbi:MAG: hypothetical protein ACYDG3_11135 [Bacillati bacterium]
MKNLPIIQCLHCNFEWRRYAKRKLTPSRNCPKCYHRLHDEGVDFIWVSTGNLQYQAEMKRAAAERKETMPNFPKKDLPDISTLLPKRTITRAKKVRFIDL